MPGSPTTPGCPGARDGAPVHVAFRVANSVGTRGYCAFVAQWLAYALPYRRFADILTGADARLGLDGATVHIRTLRGMGYVAELASHIDGRRPEVEPG